MATNGDGWQRLAAGVLREACQLDGPALARNLKWWQRLRERGPSDEDIAAAVKGFPKLRRVAMPWWPCRAFSKHGRPLFLESMSAWRKTQTGQTKRLGEIMAELAKPTCPRCGNALVVGVCIATPGWCQDHPMRGSEREAVKAKSAAWWSDWRSKGRPGLESGAAAP